MKPLSWEKQLGLASPLECAAIQSNQTNNPSNKRRAEGVRVKHGVNGNSVKLYDKAYTAKGSVLRAEATIHNADDFRVYRRKEGFLKGPAPGAVYAEASPTCIAGPKSPRKPQNAISTLLLQSMISPLWTNCSSAWNNHGNGTAVACELSVPCPRTGPYCPPSTTESSPSMASAIAISAPSSSPKVPTTNTKPVIARVKRNT
jgi:hypothetical protein